MTTTDTPRIDDIIKGGGYPNNLVQVNKINFTIAKHLGTITSTTSEIWSGTETRQKVPDYFNDINAMHDAEESLDRYQQHNFIKNLCDPMMDGKNTIRVWFIAHATAEQRAKAFLRTIGK